MVGITRSKVILIIRGKSTNSSLVFSLFFQRGSTKRQIGQPQIFQNWRWTLVFSIWGGLVIGGRDYCYYMFLLLLLFLLLSSASYVYVLFAFRHSMYTDSYTIHILSWYELKPPVIAPALAQSVTNDDGHS